MIKEFLIRWGVIIFAGFLLGTVFLAVTGGSIGDLGPFMVGVSLAGFVVTTIWMMSDRK
jgi:hypothetical protein